jgi:23S rRNA (guanosine2251-2'-O)-methyltransferase
VRGDSLLGRGHLRASVTTSRRPTSTGRPKPSRSGRAGPSTAPRQDRPRKDIPPRKSHPLRGEVVEGRRAVLELLRLNRRPVSELLVAAEAADSPELAPIVRAATQRRVPIRRLKAAEITRAALNESHQGVMARSTPIAAVPLDSLATGRSGWPAFLVVVDRVSDPRNLGAILRAAEGAGATGAVLASHESATLSPVVTKVAAGAIETLPIALVPGIAGALLELSRLGVWSVGLAPEADRSIHQLTIVDQPVALVLGSEGKGLSRLVRDRCETVVSLPQRGRISSLNVASACAVAAYEIARQRELAARPFS